MGSIGGAPKTARKGKMHTHREQWSGRILYVFLFQWLANSFFLIFFLTWGGLFVIINIKETSAHSVESIRIRLFRTEKDWQVSL